MPLKEEDVRELKIGDVVYLTGHIFTARDMGHLKIRELLDAGQPPSKDFTGAAIFTPGPVCLKNEDGSWRLNVIGPTTSIRMEPHADVVGDGHQGRDRQGAAWRRAPGRLREVRLRVPSGSSRLRCKAGPGNQVRLRRDLVRRWVCRKPFGIWSG